MNFNTRSGFVTLALLCGLLMTQFSSSALSQGARRPLYFLGGGLSVPSAPDIFSDYWQTGFNFTGGIGYPVTPSVAVLGTVGYNAHPFDEDGFLSDIGLSGYGVDVDGGKATLLTVFAALRVNLVSPQAEAVASPFFFGGIGMTRLSLSDVSVSYLGQSYGLDGPSETALGVGFGGGVDMRVAANVYLFVQGLYSIGFTDDESTHAFPISVGILIR